MRIIYPLVALLLAWVIDCPAQAISLLRIGVAVTQDIQVFA